MTTDFRPMLASSAEAPFDSDEHLFEVKWDGIRCMCTIDSMTTRLYSRSGREITRLFPELQQMPMAVDAHHAVLDGELCVLDGSTPSFHHIQRRNVLSNEAAILRAVHEHPALYIVFDLLHHDGIDLIDLPLTERRNRLENVWRGDNHATLSVTVPTRGRDLYAAAIARGLEGIVAKRLDSPYAPGRRTRHWLKIRHQRELDGVIGGFTPRGKDDFASLAIGLYAPFTEPVAEPVTVPIADPLASPLTYIGNVGTGFPAPVRRDIMERLLPLKTDVSPFADTNDYTAPTPGRIPAGTQWVQPQIVGRVGYMRFTPAGHLRHPTFLGLRNDKHPLECTWPDDRQGPAHASGEGDPM